MSSQNVHSSAWNALLIAFVFAAVAFIGQQLAAPVREAAGRVLARRIDGRIIDGLMAASTSTEGIGPLEDPLVADIGSAERPFAGFMAWGMAVSVSILALLGASAATADGKLSLTRYILVITSVVGALNLGEFYRECDMAPAVKLLARLYEPTAGAVRADGAGIRRYCADAWRARLAVIFQEFARYEIPAADNVAFGAADHLGDRAGVRFSTVRMADLMGAVRGASKMRKCNG